MAGPPTIIVHSLDHALAALAAAEETGIAIRLMSAPGAAAQGGAAWFCALTAEARAAHPLAKAEMVLDCGQEPGLALSAIRAGTKAIRIKAPARIREKIAAIATASGSQLITHDRARALDLLDARDPHREASAWLGRRRGQH
jgi:hypothetical protein